MLEDIRALLMARMFVKKEMIVGMKFSLELERNWRKEKKKAKFYTPYLHVIRSAWHAIDLIVLW